MAYRTYSGQVEQDTVAISLITAGTNDSLLFTRTAVYGAWGAGSHAVSFRRTVSIGVDGVLGSANGATLFGAASTGATDLRVGASGAVTSNGGTAIDVGGTMLTLLNRGEISGVSGVHATTTSTAVSNDGAISGRYAVDIAGSSAVVDNTGDIAGTVRGVRIIGDTGAQQVTNAGHIGGGTGTAVDIRAAGDVLLVNSGTISGRTGVNLDVIAAGDDGEKTIVNTGSIAGIDYAVFGSAAADTLRNDGTISGKINLYSGDDVYDGGHGVVVGLVEGFTGDDVLIGSLDSRNRLSGGDGADELTGGDRSDLLIGGLGADVLDGGAGFDIASWRDRGTGVQVDLGARTNPDGDLLTSIEGVEGSAFDDVLTGDAADNRLIGGDGNDRLSASGGGADTLIGGAGDDLYLPSATSRIVEAVDGGYDQVWAADSYTLPANVERLDLLQGFNANGTGNALANVLNGSIDRNVLDGKEGADILTGGVGADTFFFSTTPGAGNVDRITDFQSDDFLRFSHAVFTALAPTGTSSLAASAFATASSAQDADDRLIFDTATRTLYYDPDGTGAAAQVAVATFGPGVNPTASDIYVV